MIKKFKIKKFRQINNGYTIVETMVAVSLFVVITTAGMGTLLSANSLYQKSQNMRSIMDNLNFVMEDMSRNLRTGYSYRCITDEGDLDLPDVAMPKSGEDCWGVAFEYAYGDATDQDGDPIDNSDQWVYYMDNGGQIFKSTQGPYTQSNFIQVTPEEVVVDVGASTFSVLGAEAPSGSDRQQPFVIIKLVGEINYKNTVTPFSLQTSVSQRLIDN